MELQEAIRIAGNYIEIDRTARNNKTKNEEDKISELYCRAIETLIKEVKESNYVKN